MNLSAVYVDCVCTRRSADHPIPTSQCALCATTGQLPWGSLNRHGRQACLEDGRWPYRLARAPVTWTELRAEGLDPEGAMP
jgi:hypothetical protein